MITAKSRLKAVPPKATEPSKPKMLVFGQPGVGKTWASLDFPSCYYIDTEGGADLSHYTDKLARAGGVYLGPDEGSLSFDTVLDQIKALATEKHPYRTLIIDSITKLFNTEIANEAERLGDKDAFGASKKSAVSYMRRLVSWLTRLDMNVLLIAHEKSSWVTTADGQRGEGPPTFDCWPALAYELHLSLNVQKRGATRVARIVKSRLQTFEDGTTFPWSYDEFAARYGREVIEAEAKAIVVASAEQVAEVKKLLDVIKLPEDTVEKWFKAANVSSFDEMDAEKIEKVINSLKTRLAA